MKRKLQIAAAPFVSLLPCMMLLMMEPSEGAQVIVNPACWLPSGAAANPLPDNLWTSCVMLLEFPSEATTTNFTDSSAAPTYNAYSTAANVAPSRTATNDGGYLTWDAIDDLTYFQTNKMWNQLADHFSIYAFFKPMKEADFQLILSLGGGNVGQEGTWQFSRRADNYANTELRRKYSIAIRYEGTAGNLTDVGGQTTLVCSNWYGIGCSGNGTGWDFYLNGAKDLPYITNTVGGFGAYIGDWMSQMNIATPYFTLGGGYYYDGTIYYREAVIGFVAVFDRVLSTNEFAQLHDLRKARFGL